MQTPLWVPVLVAAIGLLGTVAAGIGGVVITQRQANLREAQAFLRERERERERWARDDVARTFEHRRDAYVQFSEAIGELAGWAYANAYQRDDPVVAPDDWGGEANKKLQVLCIYSAPATAVAAYRALSAVREMGWTSHKSGRDATFLAKEATFQAAEFELLRQIRLDLAVPGEQLAESFFDTAFGSLERLPPPSESDHDEARPR